LHPAFRLVRRSPSRLHESNGARRRQGFPSAAPPPLTPPARRAGSGSYATAVITSRFGGSPELAQR
jgi:hypothetical protein